MKRKQSLARMVWKMSAHSVTVQGQKDPWKHMGCSIAPVAVLQDELCKICNIKIYYMY